MAKLQVELTHNEAVTIFGLGKPSNEKAQMNDIPELSKQYHKILGKNSGEVLPFFVVSQNYEETTGAFDLFVGGLIENEAMQAFTLPKGEYGNVVVKPKLGFVWPAAIGEAKRFFYTQWLPETQYQPRNLEYEYHSEISIGKKPQIEIRFAVIK